MTRTRYYIGLVTSDGRPVRMHVRKGCHRMVAEAYNGGCTVYPVSGYWKGDYEPSMVVEVLHDGTLPVEPKHVAEELTKLAEQTSVLWTEERVNGGFAP